MSNHNVSTEELLLRKDFFDSFVELRKSQHLVLAKIHIQNLPWINYQFSDEAGNQIIEHVQEILLNVRQRLLTGQISESMYAVAYSTIEDSINYILEIEQQLNVLNRMNEYPFIVQLAIGLVEVDQADATEIDELILRANIAMMQSTRSGRGEIYSDEIRLRSVVREQLSRLHSDGNPPEGMYWVYQAVNLTESRAVVGYESLLRWELPGYGLLPTELVIDIAEELGCIKIIDRWTLRNVCNDDDELGLPLGNHVSINISAQTLALDSEFITELEMKIKANHPKPCNLILEITESAIVANRELLLTSINRLHALGVKFAIDDFGKGQTQLANLSQTPCDYVKIDKSLLHVSDPLIKLKLLELAVLLGQILKAQIVLEGVESEEELELARSLGIKFVQGWLFGNPLRISADNR